MKKRVAKKMAHRFLEDKTYLPFGTYEDTFQAHNDGSPAVIKTVARFPAPVRKLILAEAGGDGCHWNNPLVIAIDDSELREYEANYNPPHCR